ncbi:hypothetical protein [Streptomyces sp. I05A-00742]|uniref:hypothetical protein n=1 Tax=Streptomyces sp. I05A-00742 TaxID=2732853 RepID=UPI0014884688|nr:hypothetical protein [Streptomyces sp. I05A-00742]
MRPDTRSTVHHPAAKWLLAEEPDPKLIHERWANGALALVEAGHAFDVLRIPGSLINRLAGVPTPGNLGLLFAESGIREGVIVARNLRWYYILLPPDSTWAEQMAGAICLQRGDVLGVPHPGRSHPPGSYWVSELPDLPSGLADRVAVWRLLSRLQEQPGAGVTG